MGEPTTPSLRFADDSSTGRENGELGTAATALTSCSFESTASVIARAGQQFGETSMQKRNLVGL